MDKMYFELIRQLLCCLLFRRNTTKLLNYVALSVELIMKR